MPAHRHTARLDSRNTLQNDAGVLAVALQHDAMTQQGAARQHQAGEQ
jgi:hypothetical protein